MVEEKEEVLVLSKRGGEELYKRREVRMTGRELVRVARDGARAPSDGGRLPNRCPSHPLPPRTHGLQKKGR